MTSLVSCIPKGVSDKAVVISFLGSVEITRAAEVARPVVLGEELKEGDLVVTGASSFVVFSLGETATVRIQPESSVTLSGIADTANIEMGLEKGGVLNRVNRLSKGATYKIFTPTVVASVRGTVFSAYYEKDTNTIAVKNGRVDVSMKNRAEDVAISDGNTAVIKDAVFERPIDSVEAIVLENMTSLPSVIRIDDTEMSGNLNQEIIEKDKEVNRKLEGKIIPKTLGEIKEKYQRIDEIILYSGKVVRGVIIERGAYYKVLTTSGYVSIPAKQVRNTRVLR